MGSLFRSEEMRLCQLFLQTEAAYACVSELGELGLVQFKDLNEDLNAFQRKFVTEVRRCEEMERKLRYMEKELHKDEMKALDSGDAPPSAPPPKEMIDLEATFEKIDTELREVNTNREALKQNFLELTELREVIHKTQFYFAVYGQDIQHIMEEESAAAAQGAAISPAMGRPGSRGQVGHLGFLVGTIDQKKVMMFEKVLGYFTHSNVFVRTEEISQPLEDPVTGEMLKKHVFIVFFQGEQLRAKVKKVCEGIRCSVYPVPDTPQERDAMLTGVNTRIMDLESVLKTSLQHRQLILENVQREVRAWVIKVEKIKAIFHTLNMFRSSSNSLIAECWCPLRALDSIREALSRGEKMSGSTIATIIQPMATEETPPTYYNCNKFVKGFQEVVDAYGISTYGEVNPAPYTCITFPFLFGVMFGDSGHGLIMFLFGAWMCVYERSLAAKKITNEIFNIFFGGRYLIMMMGLFSVYTGLIYNDCFARALNIFGSQWEPHVDIEDGEELQLDPVTAHINGTAYFLGVDPIWQSAKNKINFLNSLKMKMSIILGVSHMMFGICLSVFNHIHFKKRLLVLLQFVPEIMFLGSLFGYLMVLIFYKWLAFDAVTSRCAPPLLVHYINMFMFSYKEDNNGCMEKDPISTFYSGQQTVQTLMFMLAILSVPVLLIVRPVVQITLKKIAAKRKFRYAPTSAAPLIANEVRPAVGRPGSTNENETSDSARQDKNGLENSTTSDKSENERTKSIHSSYQNDEVDYDHSAPLIANEVGASNHVNLGFNDENGHLPPYDPEADSFPADSHEEKEEPLSEVVVENVIETIEFCLGCISNTASYLRLWALSLAHAQLSEVLWTMVMHMGFAMGGRYVGGPILFVIFFFWANCTVGVLLVMEGLSAFLHTLRLHWVEFQSKFYQGRGYNFVPFSFKPILEMESLEDVV